jgi:hypothetical protein
MYILSSNHGPWGSGGATVGKTIFTCVYIEKIYFSRTSWPISIKLNTNHSWVKRIPNYSNQGPGPLQRGYNHKKWWGHLKIFSKTTELEEFIFT